MQINRLFGIVYLLLNRKSATAKELAEHFEVSKRTILRDLDTLSQAGIPIYATPGKGGGISILESFVLNKAVISEEEQSQILFALQSLGPAGHMEADAVLKKLSALFDRGGADWIEVDFSRWGNMGPDRERFELLKSAILGRQALSFSYPGIDGCTALRTVYPKKLLFKASSWYLQAYCLRKNDYRTFKINRMLSPEVLPEHFAELPPPPPAAEFSTSVQSGFVHLKLLFSTPALYRLYDEFDPKEIHGNGDGTFTVTTDFPEDRWLYSFLLSFGDSAAVLEPDRVRERLLLQAKKIQKICEEAEHDTQLSPFV